MVPVSSRPRSTLTERPTATEFNFDSDEDFMAYIEDLRSRSEFTSDVEVGPDDRIISLCTCAFDRVNARFMLVGRLVEVYENDK